ncbi:MAG: septal ring lytic transglycosylase RlpA family protein [Gammaproteobacteria bacterium]|nr:septal ring lytic transglycosylase RlpA family protein [Gammaproteobacteria bacterium]
MKMLDPRLLLLTFALLLSACGSKGPTQSAGGDSAPARPVDVSRVPDAVPRAEPPSRYGNPASYEVFGQRYHTMRTSTGHVERGMASWYGTKFHGRRTSSGEPYDMYAMTAAHKTLPLPTYAEVTNLKNGRKVIVKINDRGPFVGDRIIDLSYAAAARLDILTAGTGLVEVRAIDPQAPAPVTAQAPTRERLQLSPISTATAAAAPANPTLFLQVGAFASRDNAERLRAELERAAVGPVQISAIAGLNGPVYRVRIGPLSSVEEADRMVSSLSGHELGQPRVVID